MIVSIREENHDAFLKVLEGSTMPHTLLGHVTKGELRIDDESYGFVEDLRVQFDSALGDLLNK